MFIITDEKYLKEMGFKKNEDGDYIYKSVINGSMKKLFTVYAGSLCMRYGKGTYASTEQLKCIYNWTKKDYIKWEELK